MAEIAVAPCVGAWIETPVSATEEFVRFVAPCVGAWIETYNIVLRYRRYMVAPCVGAWIETGAVHADKRGGSGRSLRGSVD